MDDLLWIPRNLIGIWAYFIGDPRWPMVLGPIVWQLPGALMIWICLRSLREPGR